MQLISTVTLNTAQQAFAAVLPHISKDDVAPVIMHAQLDTNGVLWATDRYTIARYDLETSVAEPVLIPRDALEWVTKIVHSKLRERRVEYEIQIKANDIDLQLVLKQVAYDVPERTQTFPRGTGNFPPIERLIDTHKPAQDAYDILLLPRHTEKVYNYAKKWCKDQPIKHQFGQPYESGKPAPIKLTIGKLTTLIQPNLKL